MKCETCGVGGVKKPAMASWAVRCASCARVAMRAFEESVRIAEQAEWDARTRSQVIGDWCDRHPMILWAAFTYLGPLVLAVFLFGVLGVR